MGNTATGPECAQCAGCSFNLLVLHQSFVTSGITLKILNSSSSPFLSPQVAIHILPGDFYLCHSPFVGGELTYHTVCFYTILMLLVLSLLFLFN